MLDVCLLGCGGSLPTPNRALTSLMLSYEGRKFLIDCGEGTQLSMKLVAWGFKTLDVICFTHYHADHVIGLPGLLLTIANSGRTEPLTLIGPEGLAKVIKGLTVVAPELPYYLNLIELSCDEIENFQDKIFQSKEVIIKAIPLDHSIPCLAYTIEVNRKRKFNANKARKNKVPLSLWNMLQKGKSIKNNGIVYTPDMVLGEERKGIKISYCTDTRPIPELISFIKGSDLFICEGMYGEDEKLPKALENKHMLFSEAAHLAKNAEVKELWLTHLSPSMNNPEEHLYKAKEIFENTYIGEDRKVKSLNFE